MRLGCRYPLVEYKLGRIMGIDDNLPQGVSLIKHWAQGHLYVDSLTLNRQEYAYVRIGVMVEGIPLDGQFMYEEAEAFVKEASNRSLKELADNCGDDLKEIWIHHASSGSGMLSTRALYGFSLESDSRVYRARLDVDSLFPKLRW